MKDLDKKVSMALALFIGAFVLTLAIYGTILSAPPSVSEGSVIIVGFYKQHPDTSDKSIWNMNYEGKTWYCYEHHAFEYWNGTNIVTPKD